jgi:hypothetical protein
MFPMRMMAWIGVCELIGSTGFKSKHPLCLIGVGETLQLLPALHALIGLG